MDTDLLHKKNTIRFTLKVADKQCVCNTSARVSGVEYLEHLEYYELYERVARLRALIWIPFLVQ